MKYVDQLPFDRIARIFGREGLHIEAQTIWDNVEALARQLRPAWSRLRVDALAEKIVGLDQSHWKNIGHKKTWQIWELSTPRIACFDIAETKGTDDGLRILEGFDGIVVCDAFSTHGAIARLTGIILAYCWAHVIRKAREALTSDRARATALMELIGEIYDVDKEARDDLVKRAHLRATRSREVLERLWVWCAQQRVLPSSPMGVLIAYLMNHRPGFERFLDDPRIPLDNNLTYAARGITQKMPRPGLCRV
jgi:hypothetical protein